MRSILTKNLRMHLFFFFLVISIFIIILGSAIEMKNTTVWEYRCIDTMKISRDDARSWGVNKKTETEIAKEMAIIKHLGANCVAIDTPYDQEFIPYLSLWVKYARVNNLHIWFRGNFSSWEGWFSYPQNLTPQEHLVRTKQFILTHKNLFANGDIFTPAPEPENGWKGLGYVPQQDYPEFRQFLINEHTTAQNAFATIGKKVQTNWMSMSGGTAKGVLDQPTINALGGKVTIDHYVDSPAVMKEYIDYFHKTYNAQVIIGEFGAPIPGINQKMTDTQQAQFVNNVFHVIAEEGDAVYAVNYWDLKDGTTALIDDTDVAKPVASVIIDYYSRGKLQQWLISLSSFFSTHFLSSSK